MKRTLLLMFLMIWNPAMGQTAELPRKSPESQGVASVEVLGLIDALDKEVDSLNSIMVLRHGQVIKLLKVDLDLTARAPFRFFISDHHLYNFA